MCQWGVNGNPWSGYRIGPFLIPYAYVPPNSPNLVIVKSPFQISTSRIEVDENVNRAHFRTLAGFEVMQ